MAITDQQKILQIQKDRGKRSYNGTPLRADCGAISNTRQDLAPAG